MAGLGQLNDDVAVNNGGGGEFKLLPEDDYELEITESDVKPSSTGKGQNLSGKVQVVSGTYKGEWFFFSVNNIQHESAQSQAIGQGQLKALFEACGGEGAFGFPFGGLDDSEKLHYRPFYAHVVQDTYTPKSGKRAGVETTNNKIGKFLWEGMPEDDAPATPAGKQEAAPPPKQPEPAKAAAGSRPWKK